VKYKKRDSIDETAYSNHLLCVTPQTQPTNSMEQSLSWEAISFSASQEIPEASLPHLQKHATCPYSVSDQSSPCPYLISWRSIL